MGARRNSSVTAISGRLGQKLYGIPLYAWSKPSCSSFPSVPFFARFPGRGNKGGAHHQRLAPGRIIRTNALVNSSDMAQFKFTHQASLVNAFNQTRSFEPVNFNG